jgi:hypothetical protein
MVILANIILQLYIGLIVVVLICSLGNRPQVYYVYQNLVPSKINKMFTACRARNGYTLPRSSSSVSAILSHFGVLHIRCILLYRILWQAGRMHPSEPRFLSVPCDMCSCFVAVLSRKMPPSATSSSRWRLHTVSTLSPPSCTGNLGTCSRASFSICSSFLAVSGSSF